MPINILQMTLKNYKVESCTVPGTSYELKKQCQWRDFSFLKGNSQRKKYMLSARTEEC